jgi:hypothetical protein
MNPRREAVMPSRFLLIALAALGPTMLGAQQATLQPAAFVPSARVRIAMRFEDALCDGTEMRRIEIQQDAGKILMLTGAAVGLLGAIAVHAHPGRGIPVIVAAGALGLGGAIVAGSAYPSESFWQVTLARARRGLTTSDDVRTCLHEPAGTSAAGTQEQWTYRAGPSGVFRWGHSERAVQFTFEHGVLKEVRRTEGEVDADGPVSLGPPHDY